MRPDFSAWNGQKSTRFDPMVKHNLEVVNQFSQGITEIGLRELFKID